MADGTRTRIINEALKLFAQRGYAATSIGAIEKAAGLSPRSGSLYTHFGSKEQVLAAAVDQAAGVAEGLDLSAMLPLGDLRAELTLIARCMLQLMHGWRDLIRVMMKESEGFPAVMADARSRLFATSYRFFADWLRARGDAGGRDYEAVATIWLGAVENYWVMTYVYDHPPFGIDDDRFITQWVDTLLTALEARQ
ncbi:TetR/AcrR family transcriptional regulator [Actinocorallia populi]|uniref:TetR/AcrR family transcriptional regulator n=1 Tax=Actinocorallia populi TaxID=2079200 RepID=UPI001300328B|nr:TetR/AcrR family transcriptional regulator [Actinocorallia populi]